MDLQTVTLEDALKLLSLPRVVGVDPASGEEITAQNGRYGPYLKRGNDSRSLATEDQIFDITLDEALKIYAEPKRRGRQGAAAPPLRELGNDPASGKPMVIKDGRFGPYVTDGETNASLRKGDDVLSITDERAAELLADRRARGPVKRTAKKTAARRPAKKAAKKALARLAGRYARERRPTAVNLSGFFFQIFALKTGDSQPVLRYSVPYARCETVTAAPEGESCDPLSDTASPLVLRSVASAS